MRGAACDIIDRRCGHCCGCDGIVWVVRPRCRRTMSLASKAIACLLDADDQMSRDIPPSNHRFSTKEMRAVFNDTGCDAH